MGKNKVKKEDKSKLQNHLVFSNRVGHSEHGSLTLIQTELM